MKEHWNTRKGTLLGISAIIATIILWQAVADLIVQNRFYLPSFTDVAGSFLDLVSRGTLLIDFEISLLHFAIGLGAALVTAVPLGVAMGWYRDFDRFINPIVEILRPVPPLAWIPFAIIWFGLTHESAGFVIFVGCFFPILINTYTGFKSVPRVFVEAGKVLGCTRDISLIRYIAFPSAIPSITAGIRIAMGVGWMCLVAAELFGAGGGKYGLGQKLWWYYNLHQTSNVVVYMLLLGLIGLVIDMVFRHYIEGRVERWRAGEVRT
ncbi:MAG: ABC transporter permease [Methanomicrobiales archaeon]|nr:ABC transporter permease [Methanomicrobiales archaeon]